MPQSKLGFPVVSRKPAISRNERMLIKYVVKSMSPVSIVEDEHFKEFIKGLNADFKVPTRRTLTEHIQEEHARVRAALQADLDSAKYVCATADIWSHHHRSFLGVTCHWLTEDLGRKSALLAIRRFKGKHTAERIAEMLHETFNEYNIGPKITHVVTDNGSNFVKAFKDFTQSNSAEED